ncbi:MAG: hypothetical protein L3V56_11790 [Candidatus Magnetoovum sp. WYHC-5]|nr:hypothetical protein [Candidatus Magnetoovum sp. WYHC-5]
MGYTLIALEDKILSLYPEIEKYGITTRFSFDDEKNAWVIRFDKGGVSRYAFLDKKDADDCIDGNICIYLGTLIGFYVKEIERELTGRNFVAA